MIVGALGPCFASRWLPFVVASPDCISVIFSSKNLKFEFLRRGVRWVPAMVLGAYRPLVALPPVVGVVMAPVYGLLHALKGLGVVNLFGLDSSLFLLF